MTPDDLSELLRNRLADINTQWSIGTFGALAEFIRDSQEIVSISDDGLSVVTDRGGIRLRVLPGVRIVASESLTRESWTHRVALCLRDGAAALTGRKALTELGADTDAL